MIECHIRGCRNLSTNCLDCGRTINTITFDDTKNKIMQGRIMDWISVKERLPEDEMRCLYYVIKHIPGPDNEPTIVSGCFSND